MHSYFQSRNMEIILSVGWHFGFVSHIADHSIDEVLYLNREVYRTSYFDDAAMHEGVYNGAVQLEDGSWTITVVNLNIDEAYIDLNFDKSINQSLYRHVASTSDIKPTPDARLADADKCFKDVETKLYDTIPAGSVVIYIGLKK